MKEKVSWYSHRLETEMPLVRYGHYGIPLLLFPTAGGDAEELERFQDARAERDCPRTIHHAILLVPNHAGPPP